jgi:hypothetical protein
LRKKERNEERSSDVGDTCAGETNGGREDDAAELDIEGDDAAADDEAETEAAEDAAAVDSARRCDPAAVDAAVGQLHAALPARARTAPLRAVVMLRATLPMERCKVARQIPGPRLA